MLIYALLSQKACINKDSRKSRQVIKSIQQLDNKGKYSREKGFHWGPRARNPNRSNQILNTLYIQLKKDQILRGFFFFFTKMLQLTCNRG
jgi:hypothetical protein